jgi:hypothetical protein
MLEIDINEQQTRERLKARRNKLFEEYLKHPQETNLALGIKIIDDQVAESVERAERKRERSSPRSTQRA